MAQCYKRSMFWLPDGSPRNHIYFIIHCHFQTRMTPHFLLQNTEADIWFHDFHRMDTKPLTFHKISSFVRSHIQVVNDLVLMNTKNCLFLCENVDFWLNCPYKLFL